MEDRIAALTLPLRRQLELDDMDTDDFPSGDTSEVDRQRAEQEEARRLENLFGEVRFFLQREVDREHLTFVIRSCGGEVSWDRSVGPGSTYQESDDRITHQIVDRGAQLSKPRVVSRCYLQPQWVFDCVNARRLLPPENYFPGVQLPPHLSPFVEEVPGEYVPPEKLQMDLPSSTHHSASGSEASDDDQNSESEADAESSHAKISSSSDEDAEDVKSPPQTSSTNKTPSRRQLKKKEKELKAYVVTAFFDVYPLSGSKGKLNCHQRPDFEVKNSPNPILAGVYSRPCRGGSHHCPFPQSAGRFTKCSS